MQDRDIARLFLPLLSHPFGRLKLIWVDDGYAGELARETAQIQRHRKIKLKIGKRCDSIKGFKVLPK